MPEKEVIRLEVRRVQREVVGLGRCTFRAASIGLEEDLCWHYERPLRANYRQFCNELIAGCLQEPELSAETVDRLPERARSGLRAGVVAACELDFNLRRLRGSSLGPDERLFAAMMWHYQEWAARMGELIVGFGLAASNDLSRIVQSIVRPQLQKVQSGISNILRASGLFSQLNRSLEGHRLSALHGVPDLGRLRSQVAFSGLTKAELEKLRAPIAPSTAQLAQAMRDSSFMDAAVNSRVAGLPRITDLWPDLREVTTGLSRYLKHLQEVHRQETEVGRFVRRWENSALWFLLSLLDIRSAPMLVRLEPAAVEAAMLDALESAIQDEAFVSQIKDAVAGCELLTRTQRHNLLHALDHAHGGEWLDACPPLISGLEGAFWSIARARKIITPGRALVEQPSKLIKGVESLFKHLPAADDFVAFLRRQVFGTAGDPFRHGDADEGERRQVLFGIAALAGWLEEFADAPVRYELGARIELHLVQPRAA